MDRPPSSPYWRLVETIATLFSQAYTLARARAAAHPSPIVRLLAARDHAHCEAHLLERELAVFRAERARLASHRRPHYGSAQRAEILQVMALRGWSVKRAAERFVVHPNTIRAWRKAARSARRAARLLAEPPWNRLHEGVRWLVHELRRLCPEREFGTRTLARHILRAGIRISRTSVRRILAESPPQRPTRSALPDGAGSRGSIDHLLDPAEPYRVWHLDLTSVRLLWMHLRIAALVDGCSRRLLAVRAYRSAPTSRQMLRLVRRARRREGATPRFLITDHGCQFRRAFEGSLKEMGVRLVRGRVGSWRINAKVERLFRTLKLWQRLALPAVGGRAVQRKLEAYQLWYNRHRPHASLGVRTPDEAASGCDPPQPIPILARGPVEPVIGVRRELLGGDPCLPILRVRVTLRRAA